MFGSSKDVIDSVANNLKYYIDIQRKEDGFDLSGIDASHMHLPHRKPLPIVGIEKIHDRSLKHYFNDPNIKTTLQMSFGRIIEKQERKLQLDYNREMSVQRMISKRMSKLNFSNFGPQNALNLEKLKTGKRERIHHFPKVSHQIPAPHISRSEVLRLISSASKLIVATKLDILKGSGKEPKWTEYEVTICTGNCLSLGSKADISISFYGEKDKVKDILLFNSFTNSIPFQNNQTDVFLVETQDFGKLKYIKVGYDGNEPGNGWYLKDIIIKTCSNATSAYVFHCNTLFSSQAYGKRSFQKFMPYFAADLKDGENTQIDCESLTQKGQNGKGKQRNELSRVVHKAALEPQGISSRSTKRRPHTANKIPASFQSTTFLADNSDQIFSHQRPSFSMQTTLRCESPIKLMEKSSSRAQLEFCSRDGQNSSAETTERHPASSTPLKNKDISKEVNSIDNRSKINDENTQNFSCISSDETKVTKRIDKLTSTEDIPSNCAKLSFNEDSYYRGEIDQLLPGSFMEDVVQSDLLGSKSEKEWSTIDNSPKCTLEVPHFVDSPLKMASDIECKPLMAATQCPPENVVAIDDNDKDEVNNNFANMTCNSTNSIQSIDRNIEFVENAGTSLLQEEIVTAEISMGPISSATNNLESLQHVPSSESNSGWGIVDHTEPLKQAEEDQVKESVISEVSKTDCLPKEGNLATELTDQNDTCDTRKTKITDEKTSYYAKQNEANINCIKMHSLNLRDVFENAIQTIKNGDHYKLENLCQYYSGLPSFTDDAGRSLLHIAAIYGNGETCQVLLQNSDVQKQLNSQDKEGRTALHYGIVHNNKRIKRLLLNNGALSDIPDNNLETALDLALNMINVVEIDSN
ncbi:uncharacterized protein LOC127573252 [Pristis pectinata]|uniref:uncharacterized protein LOC127573252 n=1 Tax=Pristis pectinata TaxID=685728 RepID=UPI00223D860E|nr:uncharacterized protein LOC127573252 [Pristis pectinata]